jgi:hypothetical protein
VRNQRPRYLFWGATGLCSWAIPVFSYINVNPNSSNLGTFALFPDDTNISVEGASTEEKVKNEKVKKLNSVKIILNRLHQSPQHEKVLSY